jgi:alkylated DNA repair protein alkB family protein 1
LIFLPGYLNTSEQQELIVAALRETTGPASRTNLDSHYVPPQSGWWKKHIESPEEVIHTKSKGEYTHEPEADKRVQIDLLPMSVDILRKSHEIKQDDPTPSESVKPAAVKDLIRKMRWTIIGLEYHVSPGFASSA